MYPTVVIVLVETQRSMADVCEIGPSSATKLGDPVASEVRPATLGHLLFTVGPVHGMTDDEVESQRSQSQSGRERGLEQIFFEVKEVLVAD